METLSTSKTSVVTRATRRNIPEGAILLSEEIVLAGFMRQKLQVNGKLYKINPNCRCQNVVGMSLNTTGIVRVSRMSPLAELTSRDQAKLKFGKGYLMSYGPPSTQSRGWSKMQGEVFVSRSAPLYTTEWRGLVVRLIQEVQGSDLDRMPVQVCFS
jgi:hypothetical protein